MLLALRSARRQIPVDRGCGRIRADLERGESQARPRTPGAAEDSLETAAFSPDGKSVITAGADGLVRIWNAATGKQIAFVRDGGSNQIRAAVFSPNGMLAVTGSRYGTATIWRKNSSRPGTPQLEADQCARPAGWRRRQWHGIQQQREGARRCYPEWGHVPLRSPVEHTGSPIRKSPALNSIQFDPGNPALLLEASDDGLGRIYNWDTDKQVGRTLARHGGPCATPGSLLTARRL